jgi:hypothetical protein
MELQMDVVGVILCANREGYAPPAR